MPIQLPQHSPTDSLPASAGWLDVGQGHRIYYEQAGAAGALPVLLLHGGPGSASSARQRDPFDPTHYRIIQFDQRGCGRSTPLGETSHNHTDALIDDIEALRKHLGIGQWLVSGGSWGAALAIVYAARHRYHVLGLLLRGTFLAEHSDLEWFFHGVVAVAPEAHAAFMQALPARWRRRVVSYLQRCMRDPQTDLARATRIAQAWYAYEMQLDPVQGSARTAVPVLPEMERLLARYRVQAHYLARHFFLGGGAVMRSAAMLSGLPLVLVHGTQDQVCRPLNAWRVHRACADSRLAWANQAGHNPWHPATARLLREAADGFAATGDFSRWALAPEGPAG